MKINFILFCISVSLFCFLSCSKDCDPDCQEAYPYINLRILSKADCSDLVFGPNSIYSKVRIKPFSINDQDTSFHYLNSVEIITGSTKSEHLLIKFTEITSSKLFLDLGDGDIETLDLVRRNSDLGYCCVFEELIEVFHNDQLVFNLNQGDIFTTIKK